MKSPSRMQSLLDDSEWDLVVEVLERERAELPHEIHHTHTASMKEELRQRATRVEDLLHKLQE